MTIISHIIRTPLEQLPDAVLDQQGTTQNPHDLEDRPAEVEVVLNNGDEAIGDDGHMNLYPDSILRLAPKGLDSEMLLVPFEEEFHLPALAVKKSEVLGRKVEIVRVVDERPSEILCVIDNASEVGWIVSFVPFAGEADSLVEQDIVLPVDRLIPSNNIKIRMPILADVGLGASEMCPSEDGHAEVDGCGIDSVETSVEFKLIGDSPLLGNRYHVERILLEYSGVAEHVCLREGVPDDGRRTKSEIVRPFSMNCSDIYEFPETSAPNKLSEDEHKQMIPMGESPILRNCRDTSRRFSGTVVEEGTW